jgi:hypothetical protein
MDPRAGPLARPTCNCRQRHARRSQAAPPRVHPTALPRMPLPRSRAGGRDRRNHVGHGRIRPEPLGEHGEPVTPEPRAVAAGEADDHERVVAESEQRAHENIIGTKSAQSSSGVRQAAGESSCRDPLATIEPVRHAEPDTDEASQVPYKGRLHVHGVSDCARLPATKPFRWEDVAFSSSNWIGTSEFDSFRSSIPSPWSPL